MPSARLRRDDDTRRSDFYDPWFDAHESTATGVGVSPLRLFAASLFAAPVLLVAWARAGRSWMAGVRPGTQVGAPTVERSSAEHRDVDLAA